MSLSDFLFVLIIAGALSAALSSVTEVHRCGLVNDGSDKTFAHPYMSFQKLEASATPH